MALSIGSPNRLYLQCDVPQQEPQLHSCLCHSLDADCVLAARCEIRREGGGPAWDAPLCHRCPKNSSSVSCEALRRVWRSELNCYWAKPRRNRGPTVFPMSGTPSHTHTRTDAQARTHMEPFKVFPSATVQNAPRKNTRSRSEASDPH